MVLVVDYFENARTDLLNSSMLAFFVALSVDCFNFDGRGKVFDLP